MNDKLSILGTNSLLLTRIFLHPCISPIEEFLDFSSLFYSSHDVALLLPFLHTNLSPFHVWYEKDHKHWLLLIRAVLVWTHINITIAIQYIYLLLEIYFSYKNANLSAMFFISRFHFQTFILDACLGPDNFQNVGHTQTSGSIYAILPKSELYNYLSKNWCNIDGTSSFAFV